MDDASGFPHVGRLHRDCSAVRQVGAPLLECIEQTGIFLFEYGT